MTAPTNGQAALLPATAPPAVAAAPPAPAYVEPAGILSPSQVNTYLECDAKWYYKHLLRLPQPLTSSLALGRAVDEALSYNFRHKAETREDLPAGDVLQAFDCAFTEQFAEAELGDGESAEELHDLGEQLVGRYLVELAPDVQPALLERDGQRVPAVQVPVAGEIAGVPVQGIIDLVTEDGIVTDFKTKRDKPGTIDPDHRLQIATYCRLTGHTKARIEYMTKRRVGCHRFGADIGAADHAHLDAVYPAVQQAMRGGLYLPRRTSKMCARKYCSFWRQCEEDFGGRVKE